MVFPLVQLGFQKSQKFGFDQRSGTNGKILWFARGVNEEGPLRAGSRRSTPHFECRLCGNFLVAEGKF